MAKNDLYFFEILRFWAFWPPKWPPNSNLTWSIQHNLGVPNFFMIFMHSICLKIHFKYIFRAVFSFLTPFCFLLHIFFEISFFPVFISLPKVFEQSLFLFFFFFFLKKKHHFLQYGHHPGHPSLAPPPPPASLLRSPPPLARAVRLTLGVAVLGRWAMFLLSPMTEKCRISIN